jgi:CheY-like chemotaxis protein
MAQACACRAAGAVNDPMKQILVVDDEPRIAEICRDYLERAGFKVFTAGTGTDALAAARTKLPDLIVLDLGLPKMDGLDVTRTLRKHSNVPIIGGSISGSSAPGRGTQVTFSIPAAEPAPH